MRRLQAVYFVFPLLFPATYLGKHGCKPWGDLTAVYQPVWGARSFAYSAKLKIATFGARPTGTIWTIFQLFAAAAPRKKNDETDMGKGAEKAKWQVENNQLRSLH